MGNTVVRAIAGNRAVYRPLKSVLCDSSHPKAVMEGLLKLHPFKKVYLADLDAILGKGNHRTVIEALHNAFPEIEFLVDAGFRNVTEAQSWKTLGLGRPVLGSESLQILEQPLYIPEDIMLSLDYRDDRFMGPEILLQEFAYWPKDVIIMTLARVGTDRGPELSSLEKFRKLAPDRHFYMAGGVRHLEDLQALIQAGAAGVLLASALHDGKLTHSALSVFSDGY